MRGYAEKLVHTFSSIVHKLIGVLCAASLPFFLTLEGNLVFDDSEAIIRNRDVFSESWSRPFFNDFWGSDVKSKESHKSYRPLTILSFRLNYILNGKQVSASQFKATNLLCHIINCLLVWRTYYVITNDFGIKNKLWYMDISYLAALLFAVHPVHVEAICGVVGRADILACITFLLSFLCYRKGMGNVNVMFPYTIIAVIMAGISMLFKENGITVGGLCLSYELIIWFHQKYSIKSKSKRYSHKDVPTHIRIIRLAFVTLSVMALLYGRWIVMGSSKPVFKSIDNPAAFSKSLLTKILTYNYIYFLNFLLFLWPQWLCYDWSMGCVPLLEHITDYRVIFVVLLYLYGILLLITIYIMRRHGIGGLTTVAALLIAIPFLPAANILYPVGFVVAERILYIPSLGYCLLVAIGLQKIRLHAWKGKIKKLKTCAFLSLLLIYAVKSWNRSLDWRNEYDLFLSAYPVCPLNAKVRYNIAKVVDDKENVLWAEHEYREAIRLNPRYYQAMNNLANLLKHKKQYAEAEKHLINAVSLKKDFPAAWMNLGVVMASQKRYEEAQTAYDTALTYRKNYADCYFNLGNMYLEQQRIAEATDSWQRALSINKRHVRAWTNLLSLMDNSGQIDKALELIPEALSSLPNSGQIHFAVANVLGKLERYVDAESHFLKAIQLYGDNAQPVHYSNLGVLYHRWRKYKEAEEMYKIALDKNPRFESAISHLHSLKKIMKEKNLT